MEGLELFDTFRSSAFRLETRQEYSVPEEEELLRACREGRPLAGRPDVEDWLGYVRGVVAGGRTMDRVHVVESPLSEYLTCEFALYELSAAAGESIRIAERSVDERLDAMRSDFWLFDNQVLLWLHYDGAGRLTGSAISRAERDVAWCREQRDLALRLSVPFSSFGRFEVPAAV